MSNQGVIKEGVKKRILLVENYPDMRDLITRILEEFDIIPVTTKAEAIKQTRTSRFALVILQFHLPDGTGEELCKHIRSFDRQTPVLFVTGARSFSEKKARSAGAQGILRKDCRTLSEDLRLQTLQLV